MRAIIYHAQAPDNPTHRFNSRAHVRHNARRPSFHLSIQFQSTLIGATALTSKTLCIIFQSTRLREAQQGTNLQGYFNSHTSERCIKRSCHDSDQPYCVSIHAPIPAQLQLLHMVAHQPLVSIHAPMAQITKTNCVAVCDSFDPRASQRRFRINQNGFTNTTNVSIHVPV